MSKKGITQRLTFKGIPYRTTLDFDEITDGTQFEELVVAYFKRLSEDRENNIAEVIPSPISIGPDGGIDILVIFNMTDSVSRFQRIWVVQCKFHKRSIGLEQIGSASQTSLIEQYNAVGYLLICRTNPTTQLAQQFKNLTENSKENYQYLIWTGEQFKSRLLEQPSIHSQFFPDYLAYTNLVNEIIRGQS